MPMPPKMLEYMKREVVTAVELMSQHNTGTHMFEYGEAPDGTKYFVLIAVRSEQELKTLLEAMGVTMREYDPLARTEEQSGSRESEKSAKAKDDGGLYSENAPEPYN